MRTLTEITNAVRRDQPVTQLELRYAVAAYDVMVAKMHISQDDQMIAEFFRAAESDPKKYIGWENDPMNKHSTEWHKNVINMTPIFNQAKKELNND